MSNQGWAWSPSSNRLARAVYRLARFMASTSRALRYLSSAMNGGRELIIDKASAPVDEEVPGQADVTAEQKLTTACADYCEFHDSVVFLTGRNRAASVGRSKGSC